MRPTSPSHPLNSTSAPAPAQRLRDRVVHLNYSRNLQGYPDPRYCRPCGCKCPPSGERATESATTSVRCLTLSVRLTQRHGGAPQRAIHAAGNCVARPPRRGRVIRVQRDASTPASGRLALDKDAAAAVIGPSRTHQIAGSLGAAVSDHPNSVNSIIDSMRVRTATSSPREFSRKLQPRAPKCIGRSGNAWLMIPNSSDCAPLLPAIR